MAIKLFETSLAKIPAELQPHYVKEANGSYRLSLSDLENHLRPLKSTIASLKLQTALKSANVLPEQEDMLLRRLGDRVAVDTKDGDLVVRIRPAARGALLESDGATTLDELVGATAKEFPFLFGGNDDQTARTAKPEFKGKTITESEFRALSPLDQRRKVVDEKLQIVDDPGASKRQPRLASKEMARSQFDTLDANERAQRMRDGWTLVD